MNINLGFTKQLYCVNLYNYTTPAFITAYKSFSERKSIHSWLSGICSRQL